MGRLKYPRMEAFCENIAQGMDAKQAYLSAYPGCSEKSGASKASRMQERADVQDRIRELAKAVNAPKVMTRIERQEKLTEIANGDSTTDAIRAIDLLNKMDGEYVTRQEIDLTGALPVVIHDDI